MSAQVSPEKISRRRAHLVGAAVFAGLTMVVGIQRKQGQDIKRDSLDRDISRTTRIAPDGGRINGSWIAANFDDQGMVDLAQSVYTVIASGRPLPPVARHLLTQRCLELEASLENKRNGLRGVDLRVTTMLSIRLVELRAALHERKPEGESIGAPLTGSERDSLAKLIESAMHPFCVWDRRRLQTLFADSDRNLARPRL